MQAERINEIKRSGKQQMDDCQELISRITAESPYQRIPSQKKTWMTVPEMGKLLGLKKTDRYWLVHKNLFEMKEIAGKMRINIASTVKIKYLLYWRRMISSYARHRKEA